MFKISFAALIAFFSFLVIATEGLTAPKVGYPMFPTRGVFCDQGNESPTGNSHTYWNTMYALDLKTPASSHPGSLYAAIDGEIIAYVGCQSHNTDCGNGFGNQVKILGKDGVLVFYAHLAKSFVKTGDKIKKGQVIGIEGNTGLTGKDNRHLHFSVHYDWRYRGKDFYKNVGFLPRSVPFLIQACQETQGNCNNEYNSSKDIVCKRVSGNTEWIRGTRPTY